MEPLNRRQAHVLQQRLLAWFDANRRELPWRANRDPYRIWISEVMLQQTTVAAVSPYFERFVAAFPTVQALARASEQRILKFWEGLGYYRRARHLHAAARQLAAGHNGLLPDDPEVWLELPGVGRYILGAVLSQAFDRRLPIVEANSLRVLCRLFGYSGDPRTGAGKKWVWDAAESVLPEGRVGDFNQSLMELGALVCTPAAPACDRCPLARGCAARRDGLQDSIPPRPKAKTPVPVSEVGLVIRHGSRILLCRRPADADRWQNMWEVPHGEAAAGEDHKRSAIRIAKELTGLTIRPGAIALAVKHTVTRYSISIAFVEAERRGGEFASRFYSMARWLTIGQLADYPVSSPQRRLINELANRQPPVRGPRVSPSSRPRPDRSRG